MKDSDVPKVEMPTDNGKPGQDQGPLAQQKTGLGSKVNEQTNGTNLFVSSLRHLFFCRQPRQPLRKAMQQ